MSFASSDGWKLKKPISIQREQEDDRKPVERDAELAVDLGVDRSGGREEDDADGDVDELPEDVVVGIARDVVPRHRLEHPESVGDERAGRQEEQVVEVAEEGAELPRGRLGAGRPGNAMNRGGHQSLS